MIKSVGEPERGYGSPHALKFILIEAINIGVRDLRERRFNSFPNLARKQT